MSRNNISWYLLYASEPSKYMYRQLKLFKKNPQSFVGHKKKLVNISVLKHDRRFIRKYKDYLDWDIISARQNLSLDAIELFADYINWEKIFFNQKVSTKFLRKYIDKINSYHNWTAICTFQKLDKLFIRDYKDNMVWHSIAVNQTHIPETFFEEKEIFSRIKMTQLTQRALSEDFIRRHINDFDEQSWSNICTFSFLTEHFMEEFKDKINWEHISMWQNFSINFALKYEDKIVWENVGDHIFLTNEFLERFKDKLNWNMVSLKQIWNDLSLHLFGDYININSLICNTRPLNGVSESCLREFFYLVKPANFLNMNKKFSKDFVLEIWDGK